MMKIERTGGPISPSGRREARESLMRLREGGTLCIESGASHAALPAFVSSVVAKFLEGFADGKAPLLLTHDDEVGIDEAAAFLNLSRVTVIRMMDEGALAFRKPGKHRRLRVADLIAFERRLARQRDTALDQLSALGMTEVAPHRET